MKANLLNQLKTFGLNPAHWQIYWTEQEVILTHRKDEEIILKGKHQFGALTHLELNFF